MFFGGEWGEGGRGKLEEEEEGWISANTSNLERMGIEGLEDG